MGSNDAIIEEIIRSYPTLAEKMRSLRYSISCSHGKDPTASAASVELPAEERRRYQAINSSIRHTIQAYEDGQRRMKIIRSIYWSIEYGSDALKEVSALEAREFQQDFIQAVSQRMGMNDCTGCIYWRKLFGAGGVDIPACMYCYDTGRLRVHDGAQCYSKCLKDEPEEDELDLRRIRAYEVLA
ncbi:hypothetical protein [Oscillibacter sp.]|uniref:hypothetical protein n=1 Tax=Oscillibacter sp. TaxID=1945593 RepID=UPI002897ACF5|nr:hypothetical protein [Oscillibacter sp.]